MPNDQTIPTTTGGTATTTPDINLNLEPSVQPELTLDFSDNTNTEPPISPIQELPETKTEDRLQIEDQLVEKTLETTNTEEPKTISEETIPPQETPKTNLVELFVPTEEIVSEAVSPQQSETIDTTTETTTTKEEINQISTNIIPPTTQEFSQTIPAPQGTLEQDAQIIANIQSIAGKQNQEETSIPTQQLLTPPPSTAINLDEIFGTIPQNTPKEMVPTTAANNPITNQPLPPQTILPAFTPNNNYTLPTTNLQQIQKLLPTQKSNKKLLINIGIGIGIFVMGIFIFKTMYPLQYQSLLGKGVPSPIVSDNISNAIDSNDTTMTTNTTGEDITATIPLENTLTDTSTTNHGAAPEQSGFDAFQDLNEVIETGIDTNTIKPQLQAYIDQGKKALVTAKKSNNKDALKYSLFLRKKATALMQSIDNQSGITTDEINQQMDQFSGYLEKINNPNNVQETKLPEQTTKQIIPTPADFFGTTGTTQSIGNDTGTFSQEISGTEAPTTSGEQNTFQ